MQQRLKFLGDAKFALEKRLNEKDEELKLYADLQSVLRRILNFQNFYDNINKVEELAKKLPIALPSGSQPIEGPAAVIATETIPEIQHRIENPIVQTSEATRDGQLITLAYHGYFDQKRRLSEIGKEMNRCYLFSVSHLGRDLPPFLEHLITLKSLQREEASGGGWLYWLADGAKDRIKGVS